MTDHETGVSAHRLLYKLTSLILQQNRGEH